MLCRPSPRHQYENPTLYKGIQNFIHELLFDSMCLPYYDTFTIHDNIVISLHMTHMSLYVMVHEGNTEHPHL